MLVHNMRHLIDPLNMTGTVVMNYRGRPSQTHQLGRPLKNAGPTKGRFVIKIQVPITHPQSLQIMCYDKDRSFQTQIGPATLGESGMEKYWALDRLVRGPQGTGLRAYIDAEVTAEGDLAIYTDETKLFTW
jgi:hypothetical protein